MAKLDPEFPLVTSSFTMSNAFNIVSKGGTELDGWDVENYLAFDDAPAEKKIDWFALGATILGGIAAIAVVAALSLTGVGAIVVAGIVAGAVVGGALTGRSAYNAGYRGFDLLKATAQGALDGAVIGGISALLFSGISALGAMVGLKAGLASTMLYAGATGTTMSGGTQFVYTGEVDWEQAFKDGRKSAIFAGLFYSGANIRVQQGTVSSGGRYTIIKDRATGNVAGYGKEYGYTHIGVRYGNNSHYYTNAQGTIMAQPSTMYPPTGGMPALPSGSIVTPSGAIVLPPPTGGMPALEGGNRTGVDKTGLGIPIDKVDPIVLTDIYPSDNGAFGYLPKLGTRYDKPELDFTDVAKSINNQQIRLDYLKATEKLHLEVDQMIMDGKSKKEIAEYAVNQRNQQKIDARASMTSEQVVALEAGNIIKYKNPIGPTAQDQYDKVEKILEDLEIEKTTDEIWDMVTEKSFKKDEVIKTLLGIE